MPPTTPGEPGAGGAVVGGLVGVVDGIVVLVDVEGDVVVVSPGVVVNELVPPDDGLNGASATCDGLGRAGRSGPAAPEVMAPPVELLTASASPACLDDLADSEAASSPGDDDPGATAASSDRVEPVSAPMPDADGLPAPSTRYMPTSPTAMTTIAAAKPIKGSICRNRTVTLPRTAATYSAKTPSFPRTGTV
jgi:hypothetical protein